MKIEFNADSATVAITTPNGSLQLTGDDLRALIDRVPDLVDQGLPLPLLVVGNVSARTNRAMAPMVVLPDAAQSADPTQAGAGLFLHSPLFGVFGADLTPEDCLQWGKWLLGQHPQQVVPPDATVN